MDAVRELGHTVEFAPSKLKSGCGEHCIEVLTRLADSALKIKGHEFRLPNYVEEDDDGLNIEEADLSNTDEDFCEWRGTRSGGRCVNNRAASGDEGPNRFAELDDDDDEDVLDLEGMFSAEQTIREILCLNIEFIINIQYQHVISWQSQCMEWIACMKSPHSLQRNLNQVGRTFTKQFNLQATHNAF